MKATWYDAQGAARDVLVVGEMHDPEPGPGEVRIRIPTSGVNPGDVKKRQDAYGYGMAAKMATQAYLGTVGSAKVGFTAAERGADGKPVYVGGVIGLLERNTMRYYLAIDAYLSAYALPAAEQPERRIREWYASTERYAEQLHEMEKDEYLEMKRKEMRRQQQG